MPGTEGGSVGTSNTGRPSRSCISLHTAGPSAIPSTAGNATRSSAPSRDDSAPTTSARNAGSSNARAYPSELASARPAGASSSSTARASIPDRPRLSASSDAWKSLSARRPTTHTGSEPAPAAIDGGTSADGLSAPTAVGRNRFWSSPPT